MNKLTHQEQLRLIEGLCLCWENTSKTKLEVAEKIITDIYKIAHINGTCDNPHDDWQAEAIKLGEELKNAGITDYKRTNEKNGKP